MSVNKRKRHQKRNKKETNKKPKNYTHQQQQIKNKKK